MDRYLGAVQVILLIFIIFSSWNMIDYVHRKQGDKEYCFMNPVLIIEYIWITRAELGKVGKWFWIFLCSVIALIGTSVTDIINLGK
jgi:hypothetical protein